jgi:translation elongation factor EF-G
LGTVKQNEEHKMERYLNQKKNELENISEAIIKRTKTLTTFLSW